MTVVEENLIPSLSEEAGDGDELGRSSEMRVQVGERTVEDFVLVEMVSGGYLRPVETELLVDVAFSCFLFGRPHLGCTEVVLTFCAVQDCCLVRHGGLV
jgi:hypothetical protein